MHKEKHSEALLRLESACKLRPFGFQESAAMIAYKTLRNAGYECYFVGGCVRDALLGKTCHDIDLCTDATPDEMKALDFASRASGWTANGGKVKIVLTGEKHGTITLVCSSKDNAEADSAEITTYRTDGAYADHRHPDEVRFSRSLEEDLKRRDFTMNALAYDLETEEVICLNESDIGDLESGIIRAVGDPEERFEEDALRMLRAVRFEAQLGFEIEENTAAAICHKAKLLKNVSPERIREELEKILLSDHPEALSDLCGGLLYSIGYRSGFCAGKGSTKKDLKKSALYHMANRLSQHGVSGSWHHGKCLSAYIFDGLREGADDALLDMASCDQDNPHHYADVLRHTADVVKNLGKDEEDPKTRKALAWAALFHDIGKPYVKVREGGIDRFIGHEKASAEIWKKFAERYRFDGFTADAVYKLIVNHHRVLCTPKAIRKALSLLGEDLTEALLELQTADARAHTDPEDRLIALERAKEDLKEIERTHQAYSLGMLSIDGNDLIEMGFAPGKEIGDTLRDLLELAMAYPELNGEQELKRIVKEYPRDEWPERFPLADFGKR